MTETITRTVLCAFAAAAMVSCGPVEDDGNGGGGDGTCAPACSEREVCRDGECVVAVLNNIIPNGTPNGTPNNVVAGGSWTFLYYLHADNNLEPAALQDLQELATVGSTDRLNLVVQIDRTAGYTDEAAMNLGDFTGAKRLFVEQGNLVELEDLGEVNMDSPDTLADFVEWGLTEYPADNVAFVFWDHGGFWAGFGGDEDSGHGILDIPEIKQGLSTGMNAAGRSRLTLLGFDACNMAGYEIAKSMQEHADYYLASEEFEPGHGWNHESLRVLRDNPDASITDIGQAIIDGFKQQAEEQGTVGELTLSLVDLNALDALDAAVVGFVDEIELNPAKYGGALGRAREASLRFGKQPDPTQDFHMVDLASFGDEVAAIEPSLSSHADALKAGVDQAVMLNMTGPATSRAKGLAVYIPSRPDVYRQEYANIAAAGSWKSMLDSVFEAGGNLPSGSQPQFINPNQIADVDTSSGAFVVSGQLAEGTAQNVSQAAMFYSLYDESINTLYVLGDTAASVDPSTSQVAAQWDGNLLYVTQGTSAGYGYLSITVEGEYWRITVPMAYVPPGGGPEQLVMYTQLYDQSQQRVQDMFYLITDVGAGELTPEPGSEIYPLILVADVGTGESSWEITIDFPFDPTQPLSFEFDPFPAGAYLYVELNVYDIGGNRSFVYWEGEF